MKSNFKDGGVYFPNEHSRPIQLFICINDVSRNGFQTEKGVVVSF